MLRLLEGRLVQKSVASCCVALLKPRFLLLKREAATALLLAQFLTCLADRRLESAVFSLRTEISLVHILVLPCDRLKTANLIDVLHAPTHDRICERALATVAALARGLPRSQRSIGIRLRLLLLLLITAQRKVVIVRLPIPVLLEGIHAGLRQHHVPITHRLTEREALGREVLVRA